MFKLLIVDDEVFTREGIVEQISFHDLNISDIKQAYDGINALEICKNFVPDILLTDVRMPRMDGIELAYKLREVNPSCEIIFMSGYSDKEYLKSAISLKAVSYVEKPIDLEELELALKTAISSKSKEAKLDEQIKNNLALQLINKNNNINELKLLLKEPHFNTLYTADFFTILINILDLNIDKINNEILLDGIKNIISKNNFSDISSFKDTNLILIHLYTEKQQSYLFKHDNLVNFCLEISKYLNQYAKFFICIGKKVSGMEKIYESYESSLKALAKTFFYNYNSIIYYDEIKMSSYIFDEKLIDSFNEFLYKEDKHQLILFVKRLTIDIKENKNTSVNYVKDIYYKLYLQLVKFASNKKINLEEDNANNKSLFETFYTFSTIFEAEAYLINKINDLFCNLENKYINSDPVSKIINFINNNYSNSHLSLQDISKNTYLSPAYICTIFKENTGKTINKYISEYRLSKSKELLSDKNIKITDIASKVGYSDGNYFTKIFKKETGLTPSEYRKKFL
jgi:two-component system response regulator YesN